MFDGMQQHFQDDDDAEHIINSVTSSSYGVHITLLTSMSLCLYIILAFVSYCATMCLSLCLRLSLCIRLSLCLLSFTAK